MHRIFFVTLLLCASVAHAEDSPCPNPKKLKNLCLFVSGASEDPKPLGNHRYVYQRRMLEAACVDVEKDSAEERARKISEVWKQNESLMTCNSVQFDVMNGSILKYAAIRNFDSFIHDAIKWRVPLNRVDEDDGRTLLDYLRYHMERSKGSELERTLAGYYEKLRAAGAKHRYELDGQEPGHAR